MDRTRLSLLLDTELDTQMQTPSMWAGLNILEAYSTFPEPGSHWPTVTRQHWREGLLWKACAAQCGYCSPSLVWPISPGCWLCLSLCVRGLRRGGRALRPTLCCLAPKVSSTAGIVKPWTESHAGSWTVQAVCMAGKGCLILCVMIIHELASLVIHFVKPNSGRVGGWKCIPKLKDVVCSLEKRYTAKSLSS